jgi:hypothetical protein
MQIWKADCSLHHALVVCCNVGFDIRYNSWTRVYRKQKLPRLGGSFSLRCLFFAARRLVSVAELVS